MDFLIRLPRTQNGHNVIWVIDRLTKLAHFQPMKSTFSINRLVKFMGEIVRLHGVTISIVSNRDMCFTSVS